MSKREMISKLEREVKFYKKRIKIVEEVFKHLADIQFEELKKQLAEKDEEIKKLNQQLTEKELYEKKIGELQKEPQEAGELLKSAAKRICRLEAKIEAQENPYFF